VIIMAETRVAKLFMNGGSQAVRLPAEYRFEGDEVYIRRDERTGDVFLSSKPRPATLERFLERAGDLEEVIDFPLDRPEHDPNERIPFAEFVEDDDA
jgi:antitoxin VapB